MFSLDKKQSEKLGIFLEEQKQKLLALQRANGDNGERLQLGAIGGAITYEFTPTNLGVVTKVTWCKGMPFEATIDLSDYDQW